MPRSLVAPRLDLAALVLAFVLVPAVSFGDDFGQVLRDALRPLDPHVGTGVLYDRVLPLARMDQLKGGTSAPAVDRSRWRQAVDELRRSGADIPSLASLDAAARAVARSGVVPLAIFDRAFDRVRPELAAGGSLDDLVGRIEAGDGSVLETSRTFAATAASPRAWRGEVVEFVLEPGLFLSDLPTPPRSIEVDFDDGRGFLAIRLGQRVTVHYAAAGPRTLAARVTRADGSVGLSRFPFEVAGPGAPAPNDTLPITAGVAWQGQFGTGEAYVYLAPGRTQIANPVIVVEGFDLDNSMNWDELYALLNQENLIETLRSDGFDAVVLNFTDATDAIQKNGLVVAELIQQVQAAMPPSATMAVVGASMGGLCSRYALLWLEANAPPHRVRTWLSFDGPHGGADIPLGLQYWINFFSGQSADAAAFLAILNRPAARQMLIYHYTTPPGATGQPDPMRAGLLADFAGLGGYPAGPRRVSVANGSGNGVNQGFGPQAQVVRWVYTSAFVDVTGNIWAVPDAVSDTIFAGRLRILFSTTTQNVIVSGTRPWDGAPGGSRGSFAELDAIPAPYGDIVALHPNHCFIPSVSSLALDTTDPFFDIAGAPDLLSLTPFDAVYYPAVNEDHVLITPASAAWVRNEIESGVVSVPWQGPRAGGDLQLELGPNPFANSLDLRFALDAAGSVGLRIFGVDGRLVRRLAAGGRAAGPQRFQWDGRDDSGTLVPAGVYFAHLTTGAKSVVRRVALVR